MEQITKPGWSAVVRNTEVLILQDQGLYQTTHWYAISEGFECLLLERGDPVTAGADGGINMYLNVVW